MSAIMGKIAGETYGGWTWVDDKNRALVAIILAQQARKTLDEVGFPDRKIIIFAGRKRGREYMGWRTGTDDSLNIVEEALV